MAGRKNGARTDTEPRHRAVEITDHAAPPRTAPTCRVAGGTNGAQMGCKVSGIPRRGIPAPTRRRRSDYGPTVSDCRCDGSRQGANPCPVTSPTDKRSGRWKGRPVMAAITVEGDTGRMVWRDRTQRRPRHVSTVRRVRGAWVATVPTAPVMTDWRKGSSYVTTDESN